MMLDELLKVGFLTGSRAFGTASADSDYDVAYSIEDDGQVLATIGDLPKTKSDYFCGYYIKVEDIQINLIPLHPHDYFPWWLATKAVAATLGRSGVSNPVHKYAVFMGIVSLFKGVVCSSQPSVNSRSVEHINNKQKIRECEDKFELEPRTLPVASTEIPFE